MQEMIGSPVPEQFDGFRQVIDKFCASGEPEKVQDLFNMMQELRAKFGVIARDDDALVPLGAGATSLILAYARKGKVDKAQELLKEMEAVRDSSGRQVIDIGLMRMMLNTIYSG